MQTYWVRVVIAFASLMIASGCGGIAPVNTTNPPNTPKTPGSNGGIAASAFGFQCGTGLSTNCPNWTWPKTEAQPGLLRLWDSQVQWDMLNDSSGTYIWTNLDRWLDLIAQHLPRDVIYTFGWVPCWDAVTCVNNGTVGNGTSTPPTDLTPSGSPTFNSFVTALVNHCSPKGNCVKNLIKYWEIWNEPNNSFYWSGTESQLYDMFASAVPIIKSNVTDAKVLTPPVPGADTPWIQTWLDLENNNGRLSDIYAFHIYLRDQTPEDRFVEVQKMVSLKNATSGWASAPWWNTETNFQNTNYACASTYSAGDCTGQIVRWQLLHTSNGAGNLSWYYFDTTIGQNTQYRTAYYYMMQWLLGSTSTGPCSASGTIWSCGLVLANGSPALVIWDTSQTCANGTCTTSEQNVSSSWKNYGDLAGANYAITNATVPVGLKPVLLTSGN
jgi:hypothetical protein